MTKAGQNMIGLWRITGMEVWDADYVDMEVAAHITIRPDLTGQFQFGLVQGELDGRISRVNGKMRLAFSWTGFDENDPVGGRGWMTISGDQAEGRVFIHNGEDSAFSAIRVRVS